MRITINYFEGYPELEAELLKYPPRVRAERLRLLATTGLTFMQQEGAVLTRADGTSSEPVTEEIGVVSQKTPITSSDKARAITKGVFGQVG